MTQVSLWQEQQQSADYAELSNALYERELRLLAHTEMSNVKGLQARIKSLPYYINRTAHSMGQLQSPLLLDIQNASWSAKQSNKMPLAGQEHEVVNAWYSAIDLCLGLVVPVALNTHIILDCIDRIDQENQRFRTNVSGWFYLSKTNHNEKDKGNNNELRLLKPTKKVMSAACAGHCWHEKGKLSPLMPSLRELLLSCTINWRNFKQPLNIVIN